MNKFLSDVTLFHNTYGISIPDSPTMPDEQTVDLRISLIKEELAELEKGIADKDIIEIADALVDLMYVVNGGILDFGLHKSMSDDYYDIELWDDERYAKTPTATPEFTDSALDSLRTRITALVFAIKHQEIKFVFEMFWLTVESILAVAKNYGLKKVFSACHAEVQSSNMSKLDENGQPIYRTDGKVLKGANFFKPNLQKILYSLIDGPSGTTIVNWEAMKKIDFV